MPFIIRPAGNGDSSDLHRLSNSLSSYGFLTLPHDKQGIDELVQLSQTSFSGNLSDPDQGKYLFVLEDLDKKKVIGSSLIIARHGTKEDPHICFEVNTKKKTLQLRWDSVGRTEIGGLILDPAYRGHPQKLGKRLSYARFLYIAEHLGRFKKDLLAELLPPFTADRKSPVWECLGRKFTGLDYREADCRSRNDKTFVAASFPKEEIPISSLTPEAQAVLGIPGPETTPVARMLMQVGFYYLNQIDPFDGGPHYGATQGEIQKETVFEFLLKSIHVKLDIPGV